MRSLLHEGMPSHQGGGARTSLGGLARSAQEGRCSPVSVRPPSPAPWSQTVSMLHQAASSLFGTYFREFECQVKGCCFSYYPGKRILALISLQCWGFEGTCWVGLHSRNKDCHLREGQGQLEAAYPRGKRGRYHSSVLFPPKKHLYFMGMRAALEGISKLALNSSVWTPVTAENSCQHVG